MIDELSSNNRGAFRGCGTQFPVETAAEGAKCGLTVHNRVNARHRVNARQSGDRGIAVL